MMPASLPSGAAGPYTLSGAEDLLIGVKAGFGDAATLLG